MKRIFRNSSVFARAFILILFLLLGNTVFSQEESDYYSDTTVIEQTLFEPREQSAPNLYRKNLPEQLVKDWKEDDDFWYADKELKEKKQAVQVNNDYTPVAQRPWFQTMLWILIIGGFMGVLFWFLSENRVGLFSKKAIPANAQEEEGIPEDIFAINYQKEIDNALRLENYRLAVRLMFLRLLKTMSERNVIRYKQDKTNLDYLFEVQPTAYYAHFFRIVRNYEYSWYGLFAVNREAFEIIKKDFELIDKQLYRH